MRFGTFKFGVFKFGEVGRGYKVFLGRNTPPIVASDTPVAIVDELAAAAALDVPSLGLVPNSSYVGAILPFNEFGDAVAPAEFAFNTDVGGDVQLVPDVVEQLRLTPLAGGRLRVAWVYSPVHADFVVAEDFVIDLELATDAAVPVVPAIDPIAHRQPQRAYSVEIGPMSEGIAVVRVYSRRGGLYEANTASASARIDATPPAAVSLGLAAD